MSVRFDAALGASVQAATRDLVKPTDVVTPLAICAYCDHNLISDGRGQIKDIVSIRQRPAAVEDRAVPGHWEGDLLSGSKNSYIATLVERHTRYVMLAKVANKDTQTVVSALIKQAKKLPSELYKSLTWDREGAYGSSSLYVGDRHRRLLLRSAKSVAAWVE